jgi:hypothetical protein
MHFLGKRKSLGKIATKFEDLKEEIESEVPNTSMVLNNLFV